MLALMPSGDFISAVSKPGDADKVTLTARARAKGDLEDLQRLYLPSLEPSAAGGGTDYPYRAVASVDDFASACAAMGRAVDYPNYKAAVERRKGKARATVYARLWSTLLSLERP